MLMLKIRKLYLIGLKSTFMGANEANNVTLGLSWHNRTLREITFFLNIFKTVKEI